MRHGRTGSSSRSGRGGRRGRVAWAAAASAGALAAGAVGFTSWVGASAARAAVGLVSIDDSGVSYAGPLVIRRGGTYSGAWESEDPSVPAVSVQTTEPVTIVDAHVRGRGNLISSPLKGADLTVRNTTGYGLNPDVADRARGVFVLADDPANVDVEHTTVESVSYGIWVRGYAGPRDGTKTIRLLYNRGTNMDGRWSDGHGGWRAGTVDPGHPDNDRDFSHYIQLSGMQGVPGVDVGWNQNVQQPGAGVVDDVLNLYRASGTAASPIQVHDNLVDGAYPVRPATDTEYAGGGLIADGNHDTAANATAFVRIHDNTVISTTNYGIGFFAGHDLEAYANRVVSADALPDGQRIATQNVGLMMYDGYGDNVAHGAMFATHIHDNVVGWVNPKATWNNGRNDMWFDVSSGDTARNTPLPNPVTRDTEEHERSLWRDKAAKAGISTGVTGTPAAGGAAGTPGGGSSAAAPAAGSEGTDHQQSVTVNGQRRDFVVRVPASYATRTGPVPVVFLFHPTGGSSATVGGDSGMDAESDAHGFVLVKPQALACANGTIAWNAADSCHGGDYGAPDDGAFQDAVLADVKAHLQVDDDRVYATGFSAGGFMTYRAAQYRAGTFAAIAPIAGTIVATQTQAPAAPIAVLGFHADGDPTVCYDGCNGIAGDPLLADGPPRDGHPNTVLSFFSDHANHCTGQTLSTLPSGTTVSTATGCRADQVFYTVHNGAHSWQPDPTLNTADVIWAFFAAHPRVH